MRLASARALRSLSSGDMGLIRSRQGILVRVVLSSLFGSEKSTNFNLGTVRLNPSPLPRNGERGQDRVFRKGEGNPPKCEEERTLAYCRAGIIG